MSLFTQRISIATATILFFLALGTLFYMNAEGWNAIDAFYFTGATLTTVGYGDITPATAIGKVFSVILAFAGIGLVFYSIGIIAEYQFERNVRRIRHKKRGGRAQ